MKTTKLFLLALVLVLGSLSLTAQRGDRDGDPTERAERESDRLVTVLDLSPEQAEKIKAINLSFAEKIVAVREAGEQDREATRKAMDAMNEERRAEMKVVLTEDQFAKLEALEAQRKDRRGEGRERGGGRTRG